METKNTISSFKLPLSERELKAKGELAFAFSSSISLVDNDGNAQKIDMHKTEQNAIFAQNFKYWNQETAFLSTNNVDNPYFQGIVNMGVDAVPFILDELKKGPTTLVYALDKIFPGVMKYEGFVSLNDACKKWIEILEQV
jgi:hypothetical protein